MNIQNIKKAAFHRYTAALAGLTVSSMAMAADDPATTAAAKIGELQTGVGTVGAAILGVTLVIVGYKIISRMTGRG